MKSHHSALVLSILALIISAAALVCSVSTGPRVIQRVTITVNGEIVHEVEHIE